LFVQKKVIKENHTPLPLHPSVLAPHLSVGCGTHFVQTVLAAYHLPLKPKALQGDESRVAQCLLVIAPHGLH
jgi:hypothetical protein